MEKESKHLLGRFLFASMEAEAEDMAGESMRKNLEEDNCLV